MDRPVLIYGRSHGHSYGRKRKSLKERKCKILELGKKENGEIFHRVGVFCFIEKIHKPRWRWYGHVLWKECQVNNGSKGVDDTVEVGWWNNEEMLCRNIWMFFDSLHRTVENGETEPEWSTAQFRGIDSPKQRNIAVILKWDLIVMEICHCWNKPLGSQQTWLVLLLNQKCTTI